MATRSMFNDMESEKVCNNGLVTPAGRFQCSDAEIQHCNEISCNTVQPNAVNLNERQLYRMNCIEVEGSAVKQKKI